MDEKERQYREYLALREHNKRESMRRETSGRKNDEKYGQYFSRGIDESREKKKAVADTPYGNSEFRRKTRENQQREAEMREYLAAREADRNRQGGVRPGRSKSKKALKDGTERIESKERRRDYSKIIRNNGGKDVRKKGGRHSKLRIALISAVILLVGSAALAAGGLIIALGALGSMENIDIDENNLGIDSGVAQELDGYRNIAVLGIDARADEDDAQSRSDAIIVASINKETNEVKMFSVYRDTLLDVGDEGLDKIAHAYFYGGAQQTLRALNRNLDLNIDDVCVINWKTVADIIDSVDGIEIDIQESEIEEMNKYIPNTAKNVDGSDELIEEPGKQTLNGVQAVTYARIRKDAATGDYRRNERMKLVFSETFKKVKSSGFLTMFKVATNAMPEIKTNMGAGDILGMMVKFKSYDMTDDTTGFPYDVGSWSGQAAAGYAWYGPPVNLTNNVSKLHEQFFDQDGYSPTETVQEISNEIAYKTGIY